MNRRARQKVKGTQTPAALLARRELRRLLARGESLFHSQINASYPEFAARMDAASKIGYETWHDFKSKDEYNRAFDVCFTMYADMLIRMATANRTGKDAVEPAAFLMLLMYLGAHLNEVGLLSMQQP